VEVIKQVKQIIADSKKNVVQKRSYEAKNAESIKLITRKETKKQVKAASQ
jgi:hypothetical protein